MRTNGTRLARNSSAAVVAAIAAWSSYHHMVEVAQGVGERPDVAYVLPLSVDGMLVVASVAMVDDRRSGRRVRWSARLAFVAGVIASVAANVAAAEGTWGARIVAAWPAVALLLTVELLSRAGRPVKGVHAVDTPGESPEASQVAAPVPAEVPAAVLPAERAAPRRRRGPAKAPRRPVAQTRALAERIAQEHPDMPRAEVAERLGISDRRLREVLATTG